MKLNERKRGGKDKGKQRREGKEGEGGEKRESEGRRAMLKRTVEHARNSLVLYNWPSIPDC